MSIIDNLPENLKKIIFGEELTLEKQRCLLSNERSSGKFIRVKCPIDDYEILAPISEGTVNKIKGKIPKVDVHEHPLECCFRHGYRCDICKNEFDGCLSFFCANCDFDCCFECYYDVHPVDHPNFKEIEFLESEKDFKVLIEENEKIPTLVDFNADWCGPCKRLKPLLVREAKKNGFLLVSVNVDKNKKLSEEYKIQGIPQVNMFVSGKEVFKFNGFDINGLTNCIKLGLEKVNQSK